MKSYELELNLYLPETVVIIRKVYGKYIIANTSHPNRKYSFDTKEEVYIAIGPNKKRQQFRDLTGENLLFGRQ